ncbi:MAG: hypothetical protein JO257_03415 [Deltaproteobacteria bacterium]|nr:hypothetical protein [Deltaproteobacteria bacterium]
MRRSIVLAVVAACYTGTPAPVMVARVEPAPPRHVMHYATPDPRCDHDAELALAPLVEAAVNNRDQLWQLIQGEPKYGAPGAMDEATFIAFLPTAEGRRWLLEGPLFGSMFEFARLHCMNYGPSQH